MIHTALLALAVAYVAASLVVVQKRPGYFSAVCFNSYPLALFFGEGLGGAFVLVGALIALSRWPARKFQFAPGELLLAVWLVAISASLLVSFQVDVSGVALIELLGLSGGMYAMARTYGDDDRVIIDLIVGCIIGVLICTPALLIAELSAPLQDILRGRLGYVSGLQPVGLAAMLEVPAAGLLALAFFGRLSRLKTAALFASVALFFTPLSVALGTRSLIAGIALVVVAYLAIDAWQTKSVKKIVIAAVLLAALAFAAYVAASLLSETRIGAMLLFGFNRLSSNFSGDGIQLDESTLGRLRLYAEAWRLFIDAPLFGYGIGSFQYLADSQDHLYPHNLTLELLVTCGLVGTLVLAISVAPMICGAFKSTLNRHASAATVFVLGLLLIAAFRQQVSGSLSLAKSLFFALGLCAARYSPPVTYNRQDRMIRSRLPR